MDIATFVRQILDALSHLEKIRRIEIHPEGKTVTGRGFITENFFLAFYYNEATATLSFALIENAVRIWGIDFDNLRGWHLHAATDPSKHEKIKPQTIQSIIQELASVLKK